MSKINKKTAIAHTGIALVFSFGLAACSGGEEHEVHAVDKVDEAAELARADAPEAEVVEFEDTDNTMTTEADTTTEDGVVTEDGVATDAETAVVEDTADAEEAIAQDVATEETVVEEEVETEEDVVAEDTADTMTAASGLSANAGKELYESTCHVCHEAGVLGAPKFGDTAAWAPRIDKGIDTLHKHSAEGFKGMPPQATGDVSEEQVYAAVDYMVSQSS